MKKRLMDFLCAIFVIITTAIFGIYVQDNFPGVLKYITLFMYSVSLVFMVAISFNGVFGLIGKITKLKYGVYVFHFLTGSISFLGVYSLFVAYQYGMFVHYVVATSVASIPYIPVIIRGFKR